MNSFIEVVFGLILILTVLGYIAAMIYHLSVVIPENNKAAIQYEEGSK